jgi:hypothetical protein
VLWKINTVIQPQSFYQCNFPPTISCKMSTSSSIVAERPLILLNPEAKFQDIIQEIKEIQEFLSGHWGINEEADDTVEAVICEKFTLNNIE